ncbi:BamA/TamA family outer membrane protein [Alcanivorax sp. DP30]|nr:BamA/TamA family outer membrane protein [Alcanivorax sp. DP30]
MWKRTLLAAAIGFTGGTSHADFFQDYMIDPEDGMLDSSRFLSELPMSFMPVPVVITEPAVGNGLGVMGIFFHESEEQKQMRVEGNAPSILPNNISVLGLMGTENGSRGIAAGHIGFWRDDTIRYRGFALLPDLNLDFYNFAGRTLDRPIELNVKGPAAVQELKFRMGESRWMLGARQVYRQVELDLVEDIKLPSPRLSQVVNRFLDEQLGDRIHTSGLGLLAEYDSRDSPLSPQSGLYYNANYVWYNDSLGSDVDFGSYTLQGLNYWKVNDKFNFALRMQYDGIEAGDSTRLPPYVLPYVDLRGIPAVRYQGKAVAVAEVEATWKPTLRWRFNAFTGGGRAAESASELSDAEVANNYGAGFRYLVARRYGMTMGIDVARGPEDTAWYIQAGSSW